MKLILRKVILNITSGEQETMLNNFLRAGKHIIPLGWSLHIELIPYQLTEKITMHKGKWIYLQGGIFVKNIFCLPFLIWI